MIIISLYIANYFAKVPVHKKKKTVLV